jgi:ABC-2 type transport system ATP-binding protein
MSVVQIQNVTKTFGRLRAVDELSLTVPKGSIYGFIGPNGSGKTTTLRMIMNIIYPEHGSILVFGQHSNSRLRDRIGYLPEERGLYRKMKVLDILIFYGRLKNASQVRRKALDWLERFGLGEWANKKVEALSKGMSQKIQFISAVLAEPELLILDEPFSGLDPVNLDQLRDTVLKLRRNGTTIIFSTHDMAVAESMCDSIFMIFKGRKVLDGTLSDIQDQYSENLLRIVTNDSQTSLNHIEGIAAIRDIGREKELRLAPQSDPQQVLKDVLNHVRLERFEMARPSLHDIFVRIAKPHDKEADDE